MVLAIYDLSGIQSFIFASNKLKEMVGGSSIVTEALFGNIPSVLGEQREDWKSSVFTFSDTDTAKTVYIGGGNALVTYKDGDEYEKKTRELQKGIFLQTGGALRLCSACIETETSANLKDVQKRLMDDLDKQKKNMPLAATTGGFSINAHENESFEPVLLINGGVVAPKTKYLKREAANADGKKKFITEMDKFFEAGKDGKRVLAVIHIDGNTMGIKIREFVESLGDGNLIDQLNEMRKLSIAISNAFKDVLDTVIDELFVNQTVDIPFRPIVSDGDDITVICKSTDAFEFVIRFMDKLSDTKIAGLKGFTLSAGAGIAFVNVGFPFYTAYDMAEQLCKSAKKNALGTGKSSVDFHICLGGVTTDIKEYRKKNMTFNHDGMEYNLLRRPYIFNSEASDSFEAFYNMKETVIGSGVARSKLKGLRNEYGKGVLAATTYWDFLKAKASADENLEKLLKLTKEPFDKKGTATLFDILDVMDLLDATAATKEEK